jgi:hypothetical protein
MSDYLDSIAADFKRDIASHVATIKRNDGLYRHIEFRKPKHGWHHWFEIVTWPNGLIIRGDMETWVFSRVEDMFTFFRGDRVSPSYWQEKLQCARDDAKDFSIDSLKQQAACYLDNWGDDLPPSKRTEIIAELESEIFSRYGDHDEHEALSELFDCKYQLNPDDRRRVVRFDPCDGPWGKRWSYHYVWCCWAIVWAIAEWEKLTAKETAA